MEDCTHERKNDMNIFDIENLTFAYPDSRDDSGQVYLPPAISDVSLHIGQGEFVCVLGNSGCGKTTLLRQLKPSMKPHGRSGGNVRFMEKNLMGAEESLSERGAAAQIGFVQQEVDAQLVTDKVWHELAFGLESLGYDNGFIRRRTSEMCSFFGLSGIFHKNVTELSGGQKQMVNLASVMALSPEALILDEPTSQLDPIAANEFISSLVRINRELGTTIIMTEHRLEEVLPVCSRVILMESGRVVCDGDVSTVAEYLRCENGREGMYLSMPAAVQIYVGLGSLASANESLQASPPVTVSEGRGWLSAFDRSYRADGGVVRTDWEGGRTPGKAAVRLDEVSFRYDRSGDDVLKGLSLDIYENEILMINGSNGCGKSTLLSLIAGLYKPHTGKIRLAKNKTVAMLPQNPELLFTRRSVRDELCGAGDSEGLREVVRFCRLSELLDRHPYDLSGGEKQRLALAKLLLAEPDIILMDEPTKGLDNEFKLQLKDMLERLRSEGRTIVVVSHDIEFCAVAGDRIALLFDGEVAAAGSVREYMSENSFFTTAAARIARNTLDGAVTVSDVLSAYGAGGGDNPGSPGYQSAGDAEQADSGADEVRVEAAGRTLQLSWLQTLVISVSAVIIAGCFWLTMSIDDFSGLVHQMRVTALGKRYIGMYSVMIAAIAALLFSIRPIVRSKNEAIVMESKRKPGRRTAASVISIIILMPVTIWFGCERLGDRKYIFISLLVLLEAMLPFFVSFEERKPRTRDIVTLAVMCALAVTGRAAFFMLPNFTPVMAIVIIAGVAFGCEGGFITGAMTMLVSNFIMGQGPWTPWQMFAMGLVGFLAGLFFARSGVRTKLMTKLGLCIFGALVCIIVYGGIMNPASVIMWQPQVNMSMILAAYVTGFPFDVAQAAATVLALWFLARPFLEKLDRVRIKYGVL